MNFARQILDSGIMYSWEDHDNSHRSKEWTAEIALEIFMGIKDALLLKKLSADDYLDALDGGELQKLFSPGFRGYPYYWLRWPYIHEALVMLQELDLIYRGNKGYINGSGSDELFLLGKVGMELIQSAQTTQAIKDGAKALIDSWSPVS